MLGFPLGPFLAIPRFLTENPDDSKPVLETRLPLKLSAQAVEPPFVPVTMIKLLEAVEKQLK